MLKRLCWGLLATTVFSGFNATAGISADLTYGDFPEVPQVHRFDDTFREAGFYVGARGGAALVQDTEFGIAGAIQVDNAYEIGPVGGVFLGFELHDLYEGAGVRLEGEVGYSLLDVDTHTVGGTVTAAADSFGSTNVLTGMANLYIDYGMGAFRPFAGGGLGVARVSFDHHGVTGALSVMDDEANALAWQVMGGIGFDATSMLTIEGMVRYQSVQDVELVSSTGPTSRVDLSATQVLLGARLRF